MPGTIHATRSSRLPAAANTVAPFAASSSMAPPIPDAPAPSTNSAATAGVLESYTEGAKRGSGGKHKRKNRGKPQDDSASKRPSRPRPTHFIALPLADPDLHARVRTLTTRLLTSAPRVEGLDKSIVIEGVRMHLTLGVMALEGAKEPSNTEDATGEAEGSSLEKEKKRTVDSALARLSALRPKILEILCGDPLEVTLSGIEVMKVRKRRKNSAAVQSRRGETREDAKQEEIEEAMDAAQDGGDEAPVPEYKQQEQRDAGDSQSSDFNTNADFEEFADVLYASVPESAGRNSRVWEVSRLVEAEFKEAGFTTDTRPLKLHLTILNTSHRKPRRRYLPFSYSAVKSVIATAGLSDSRSNDPSAGAESLQRELPVTPKPNQCTEFGQWEVGSIELWVMGSRDKEGRYISLGGISLTPSGDGVRVS